MSHQHISGRDPKTGRCITINVEDGLIASVSSALEDCDHWISAGLVDLQVNGYRGFDLNSTDMSPATVSQLTKEMLAVGVTTFAPTIITASESEIVERLACISQARELDPVAFACIPFIHVEGPHISPFDGYRGAHPVEHVRPPSIAEFDRWQAACNGLVGLVTLSPHFPGSEEYIAALTHRGVHVSIGHTHASSVQIHAAAAAGARLSTHLGNGVALQLDRHSNPIWGQLAEDRLTASFIADGHHLPADALKAMVHAKGVQRSILVSDTVALAGMSPGNYFAPIGGQVELTADGRLSMAGSSTLAGAVAPLIACVGRAVQMTGLPLADVLKMATEYPGAFTNNRGTLVSGQRADILRFHWNQQDAVATVKDVWLAGNCVFPAS